VRFVHERGNERPVGRRQEWQRTATQLLAAVLRRVRALASADQPAAVNGESSWLEAQGADADRGAPSDATTGLDGVVADCAFYQAGRRRPGSLSAGGAARLARRTDGFVWIGLRQPTEHDVAAVAREFDLPPLAVEDAVKAHQRPKLEVYDDVLFMVLKPVTYIDHDEVVDISEIAVFLGATFVVTVRHGRSDVLRRVRQQLDAGDPGLLRHGPTAVLYRAADLVVDGYEATIELINDDVDEIESQVFSSSDSSSDLSSSADDHSERIYKLKREIAEFRRAVHPLAAPLAKLAEGTVPHTDPAAAPYFRDVHDHVMRAGDAIDGHDRLLSDVLQADLARFAARQGRIAAQQSEIALQQNEIAVRQNEDMRKISAWAAIALVPTAIAGIYGMNFDNMPELSWRYGYFAVLGVIATVCLVLHGLFKRNGWL
jgi:magnesium transporter